MTNLEYLKKVKKDDDGLSEIETSKYEFRKTKALEIIAEQIIHLDDTLAYVLSALENIETTLNRR